MQIGDDLFKKPELAPVFNSESYRIAYDHYKSKCKVNSTEELKSWQKNEQYLLVEETVNLLQKARQKQFNPSRDIRDMAEESQINEFKLKMTALIHYFKERMVVLEEEERFREEQKYQDMMFLENMRQKVERDSIPRPQLYNEMNDYTNQNSAIPPPGNRWTPYRQHQGGPAYYGVGGGGYPPRGGYQPNYGNNVGRGYWNS